MLHIMRLWDARQPASVATGFGPGWDLREPEIRRRKRAKDEIEALLRQLVGQATAGADPVFVAEVVETVGSRAAPKKRAAPVDQINWRAVMARGDAQLDRLEDQLRALIRERERDEDDMLVLLMSL